MRTCSVIVIATAVAMATVAILATIGWQATQSDVAPRSSIGQHEFHDGVKIHEVRRSVSDGANIRESWTEFVEASQDGAREKRKAQNDEMQHDSSKAANRESNFNLNAKISVEETPRIPSFIDLNGSWNITNQNGSVAVVGSVPGNVHTALQTAGVIEDPYYRFNDVVYRWISLDSWTYTRAFTVEDPLILTKAARVVCDGLDTVASVSLNGVILGSSDNQFVGYVFDATGILKEGENVVEVRFQSAVGYAQREFDSHPYLVPPSCPPDDYHPECHVNFIRKAQCSFSWDWGPTFPTQGIWRSIGVETFEVVVFRSIIPLPFRDGNGWNLNVSVEFDVNDDLTSVSGLLSLTIAELSAQFETSVTVGRNDVSVTVTLPVGEEVVEWWPRGYGEAKLYHVAVSFTPTVEPPVTISTAVWTGFREIELIQDPLDNGLTFYFKINGVPIFMKGSNWIPMDSFYDRVDYNRLRHLLDSAVYANMNSIRIWGGGVYESDDFYDIADELGILVWQDMMFACAMYPVHEPFLSSVDREIRYQVRRLGRHPSLIAWTANNENEGALVDNWYGTSGENYTRYKSDYVTLYIDVVRAAIMDIDSSRPFLPSSPSNGLMTEENDWISETPRPGAPEYGDVHYYNYHDDCLNLDLYPRARYSSEYGFQSWPSYHTLKEIADPVEDLVYGSEFFYHREHHHLALNGTEQVIRRYFQWPDTGDKHRDFRSYIYLTQVAQAICYQAQSEFNRRSRSNSSVVTMGALYWQHNDIWQAPTWSTIDYKGELKMAHYFAANFFADPTVSVIEEENGLIAVYAINDQLTAVPSVELVIEMRTWNNFSTLMEWTYIVDVPAAGALKIFTKSRTELLSEGFCNSEDFCFLNVFLRNASQTLTAPKAFYFVAWKNAEGMQDPAIQVSSVDGVDDSGSRFVVTLTASAVSAFTWVEAVGIPGRFSDNGFLLLQPTIRLGFRSLQAGLLPETVLSSITVTTLHGLYNTNDYK